MRIVAFNQNMAIETSHLRNSKYTDSTERLGCYRKNLTVSNVSAQLAVCRRLETIEGNFTGNNISFQSTVCNLLGKCSCHDHLILHAAECQLLGVCVSAMEAHEGILMCVIKFTLDGFLIHIIRYSVVDIKQRYNIVAYCSTDELA